MKSIPDELFDDPRVARIILATADPEAIRRGLELRTADGALLREGLQNGRIVVVDKGWKGLGPTELSEIFSVVKESKTLPDAERRLGRLYARWARRPYGSVAPSLADVLGTPKRRAVISLDVGTNEPAWIQLAIDRLLLQKFPAGEHENPDPVELRESRLTKDDYVNNRPTDYMRACLPYIGRVQTGQFEELSTVAGVGGLVLFSVRMPVIKAPGEKALKGTDKIPERSWQTWGESYGAAMRSFAATATEIATLGLMPGADRSPVINFREYYFYKVDRAYQAPKRLETLSDAWENGEKGKAGVIRENSGADPGIDVTRQVPERAVTEDMRQKSFAAFHSRVGDSIDAFCAP